MPGGAAPWPPARRLLRRADFRAAYEQGMRRSSRHFTLFGRLRCAPGALAEGSRFGITVTRKMGGAVVRNRIRRRTRELLRRQPWLAGTPVCDFVVNPRASVAAAEWAGLGPELAELVAQLRTALGRAAETA